MHLRPSAKFSSKKHKFLRSLAEFLEALAFYVVIIFFTYILPASLIVLRLSMCTYIDISFFYVFIVLNSNYFGCI